MTVMLSHISKTLDAYLALHPEEIRHLGGLLKQIERGDAVNLRSEFRGHVTASAAILSPGGKVLTIYHNLLQAHLTPGGHIEQGDTSLTGAAAREGSEETGLPLASLHLVDTGDLPVPADINGHAIPANPRKNEPEHWHWDFRFIFRTEHTDLLTPQIEEVSQANWSDPSVLTGQLRRRVSEFLAA
jgi:ADP-ribose pyrophosphatase YjhB (NUDIX family)